MQLAKMGKVGRSGRGSRKFGKAGRGADYNLITTEELGVSISHAVKNSLIIDGQFCKYRVPL